MKILIVEDLQLKIDELSKFLLHVIPSLEIVVRKSYQSGLEEVVSNHENYDLVILDMSMQNYDLTENESGGDPINEVGIHILNHMYYRDIENKVIVFTMYGNFGDDNYSLKELNDRLMNEFPENYLGFVFFNASEDKWKSELMSLLQKNSFIK